MCGAATAYRVTCADVVLSDAAGCVLSHLSRGPQARLNVVPVAAGQVVSNAAGLGGRVLDLVQLSPAVSRLQQSAAILLATCPMICSLPSTLTGQPDPQISIRAAVR